MLRVHTFGGCAVTRDGAPVDALAGRRKALALLAILAAAGERGVSRERVVAYLWPENDEARARASLKQLVHALRRHSSAPALLLGGADLRLNPDVITSDVAEFRAAMGRRDYESAAALYAGPFLDGFHLRGSDRIDHWLSAERTPLASDFARALRALAERASAQGDLDLAIEWWRRLAQAEPLSARAATGLIAALAAAGEHAAALEHARFYQLHISEEIGAPDPSVAAFIARLGEADVVPIADRLASTKSATPPGVASDESPAVRPSIAVLPFANTNGDSADQPLTDGLTDELIGALGKLTGLKVAGRTSVYALHGRGMDARAIAQALGVATVLEGSVRRDGARLRVSVQLVDATDEALLWAEVYSRDLSDVFAVQEEIAQAILIALRVELGRGVGPGEHTRLVGRPPSKLEAYELYLKGRYVWSTRFSGEALRLALDYFTRAAACDPDYARPHAGISDVHALLAIFGHGRADVEFAAAKAAANRALALDDSLAEAHISLAHVLFVHDFAWEAAERTFQRAIALDPANTIAHYVFAVCLQDQGRFEEALAELQIAKSLDPLSGHVLNLTGRVLVNSRQPDEAIRALSEALELNPHSDLAYQQLGHAFLQKGMHDEAIAAMRQAAGLSGTRDAAHLAYALAVTGNAPEARRVLRELRGATVPHGMLPFHLAMVYAGLGEADEAFKWLDRARAERAAFLDGVKVTPAFDHLHDDPRWAALLRRMGLEA